MSSQLPPPFEHFQQLADAALAHWAPGAVVKFYSLKAVGNSDAAVVKVDIAPTAAIDLDAGQYVLKLCLPSKWNEQDTEIAAHTRAQARAPVFALNHIPQLRNSFLSPGNLGYAILYEIAGRSLDSYIATDVRESPGFLEVCGDVTHELLANWIDESPSCDMSAAELIKAWLGYRLDPEKAPTLHEFAAALAGSRPRLLVVNDEVLPNPLTFVAFSDTQRWQSRVVFKGLEHGDLHGGNLLVHRRRPDNKEFWIIDFALSRENPVGFDLAYLELSHLLNSLGDSDPRVVLEILRLIDSEPESRFVPPGSKWLLDMIRMMRARLSQWLIATHPRRSDDLNRQFILARLAAGVNWANKPISSGRRAVALYYAGWAAKQYILNFEPDSQETFWRWAGTDTTVARPRPAPAGADLALWEQLWNATNGFSPSAGRLILVSEALRNMPDLAALGQLPISAVIDLDPQSQAQGLFGAVSPVLHTRRGIHSSGDTFGPIDFTRATAWMMAAGWSLKSEPPTDFATWRYKKLHLIRELVRAIHGQTSPDKLIVLSLAGGALDHQMPLARLEHVLDSIDEASLGHATVFHIGPTQCSARIRHTHVPIDLSFFLSQLARAFGSLGDQSMPLVPGRERSWCAVPLDGVRAMEENFHLLHSLILDNSPSPEAASDAFWRGNPPTWFDLHSGVDLPRSVGAALRENLRRALEEVRNRTVLLQHTPGSGGTTVALRAAWDLRTEYPTAVLRRASPALSDRIQDLYNRAERPVLLVADAGQLTESAREDLYRELQQRNVRMVLLYVRRVFQAARQGVVLEDPMERGEARTFLDSYASLTEHPFRKRELYRITHDDTLAQYRTPFFYGLTTFERDFAGTRVYVFNHIAGLRGKSREVMEYLALVTIYSNSGLHETFLRRMLGLSDSSLLALTDALGAGPARLAIRRNGLFRLTHQVIAEQVLDRLQGENWRLELKLLAVDFISDLARHLDTQSQMLLDLLRQMLVDRQGTEIDDVEDRQQFAPLIETIDSIDPALGHRVLLALTEHFPSEAHFWNHLGRHQIYRMKRDLDKAEEYLVQATALSPNDFIHHHTLGLVRRYRVRQTMNAAQTRGPAELIELIAPLFDAAVRSFETTREINQDNIYAYITHVQMILDVVAKLKHVSAVRTIAQVAADAQEWIQDQIAKASDLIDTASELYATLDKADTYLASCVADLLKLYDNLDDVIRVWEVANERSGGNSASRRALAYAYVMRSGRRWNELSEAELRRIATLMELNLRQAGRREDDYRLWFEAYKLLPEFDVDEALSRLRVWAERFPSWRAFYYVYALQFYLWFIGRTERTDDFEVALERCQALAFGRKNVSHNWLGWLPEACPLVASGDLGEWDRRQNFWATAVGLRHVNGVIDVIHGPQAGSIIIDGRIRAFFVPMKDFSANKDENEPVNFLVGFSASGLRAWRVSRGWVGDGARHGAASFDVPVFGTVPARVSDEIKNARAREIEAERVKTFVHDLITAKSALGAPLSVEQLAEQVDACFGVDGLALRLGFKDISSLVATGDRYKFVVDGDQTIVRDVLAEASFSGGVLRQTERLRGQIFRRRPEEQWGLLLDDNDRVRFFAQRFVRQGHWKRLQQGSVADFKPDVSARGDTAVDVQFIQHGDLRKLVQAKCLKFITEATEKGERIKKSELVNKLYELFNGPIPGVASDAAKGGLEALLNEVDGISFEGEGLARVVSINESRAIGRLQRGDRYSEFYNPGAKPSTKAFEPKLAAVHGSPSVHSGEGLAPAEVSRRVLEILRGEPSGRLEITTLGERLKEYFPVEGRLAAHLGVKTLRAFLDGIEGVEISGAPPRLWVELRKRVAGRPDKDDSHLRRTSKGADRLVAGDLIVRLLSDAPGRALSIQALGAKLKPHYPAGPLAKQLGARTFLEYLKSLNTVEIRGVAPSLTVALAVDKETPILGSE